jgi:predicted GNAT family acetyltransferase
MSRGLHATGQASACADEQSRRFLDSGKAFCTPFTNLADTASNAIYRRIEHRPL